MTCTLWPNAAADHGRHRHGRPFLLLEVTPEAGRWIALTSVPRAERVEIPREAKIGQCGQWTDVPTFTDDPSRHVFTIPWCSLPRVSSREWRHVEGLGINDAALNSILLVAKTRSATMTRRYSCA